MASFNSRSTAFRSNSHRILQRAWRQSKVFQPQEKATREHKPLRGVCSYHIAVAENVRHYTVDWIDNHQPTTKLSSAMAGRFSAGTTLMQCFVDTPAIYLYRGIVDFRKSINGLVALVEQELNRSPFDPALYLFSNRAHDKLKLLYWDNTGFALWYKRLEKQRFKWPKHNDENIELKISEEQLHWLLSGYDIIGHQPLYFNSTS